MHVKKYLGIINSRIQNEGQNWACVRHTYNEKRHRKGLPCFVCDLSADPCQVCLGQKFDSFDDFVYCNKAAEEGFDTRK